MLSAILQGYTVVLYEEWEVCRFVTLLDHLREAGASRLPGLPMPHSKDLEDVGWDFWREESHDWVKFRICKASC